MSKKSFELHFEKKNGALSTVLSPETYSALLEAPCCIPYSKNGKRGLLYCGAHKYEEAERVLRESVKDCPLLAQAFTQVMHLAEFDYTTGEFHIPRSAAQFAQIEGEAILTSVSRCWAYLRAKETGRPREGRVIAWNR